jgi:DNA helicase-2/ATP-dependent DNA helicase PcrA
MYAAPDALAAISASFMKDYKKKQPFSLPRKPPSNVPFNNSFAAASTGTYIHSIQTGISSYTSNTDFDLETYLEAPQESSQQAARNCPPQVFNQTVGRMDPTPSNSVAPSSSHTWSTPPRLPRSSGTCSAPPSSSLAPPIVRRPGEERLATAPRNPRSFHPVSSHQTEMNARNTTLHISKKSTVPASGVHSIPYRENQAPSAGPSNSGSRNPNLSTRNTNAVDYNMTFVGSDTSADSIIVVSSPPKLTNHPHMSAVTALPTVINMSSLTEASCSQPPLQGVPQAAGVKRRLGMGRNTTGYSNKKFKKPV